MNERKPCPYCGEMIANTARKCRFCGEMLPDAAVASQPAPVADAPQTEEPDSDFYDELEKTPFFQEYFIDTYFRHYADFKGRASRTKFWLSYLAYFIVALGVIGAMLLLSATGSAGATVGIVLLVVFNLAIVVPGLALCVRRLRDAGVNPWMILISLIPFIGGIILLVMLCKYTNYTDPETDETDYDAHNVPTKFDAGSIGITLGCIALLIGGCIVSSRAMSHDYDLDEYETEAVVYDEFDYEANKKKLFAMSESAPYICHFSDGREFYLSLDRENGDGRYLSPLGNMYLLRIKTDESLSEDSSGIVCEVRTLDGGSTDAAFVFELTYGYMGERHYVRSTVEGQMLGMDGESVFEFSGWEQE
ncbi:MAG: DUF805 domain-containing protein [Muribaculaceae bacterium]|nr:DUF805 domain-containing protein [Muribaculaceae bacterium]